MTTSPSLRSRAVLGGCGLLLAGPTVLGFFTGGYFAGPRDWAGAIAWLLVAAAALLGQRLIPESRGGRLALAGVLLLTAWTLLSLLWAPVEGSAYQYGQTAAMYAGVLIASTALIRGRMAQRAVVPALAGGTLIIIGYGLSERLLPGLLHFARSVSAEGRLEQPLTYWNAMGEVGALGFVLCTSLAGDASRVRWLRSAAAAATVPLGMGLYISFSRGALFACVAGLIALAVLVPRREQLRSIVCCLVAGVLASVAAAPMHGFGSLSGGLSGLEQQGAIAFAAIVVLGAAAAAAQWRLAREPAGELTFPRRAPWLALAAILVGLGIAIVVGAHEGAGTGKTLGAGASRLASFQSNRYAYWAVALRAFAAEPIHGVGAGGWAVSWLEHRHISESAQDAHSLELQTLAELGLIGFALLLAFIGGVAWAARDARRVAPVLAGGPIAGLVVYLAHSPLDWDWEMPAVTLIAFVLAGAVIGLAELARPARARAGAQRSSGRGQTAIGA